MSENKKLNEVTIIKTIDNCIDCEFHNVIPDPDPNDRFCDDDIAVVCIKTLISEEEKFNKRDSKYCSDKQDFKCVTISCRPHNKRNESIIPDWCPLLNSNK